MTKQPARRPVFPVSLLAEGRPCLVVGGGKVAARKVGLLLEAGAKVRVVSPEADAEILERVAQGAVALMARPFEPSDVEGAFLVFAATSDKAVNRSVLEACAERGILACSVDGNWPAGAFVTPAVFRNDNLVVAVSTGGRSCRQSRLIKEDVARQADLLRDADLLVLGTSHNYLGVEKREPYHLVGKRLESVGRMLAQVRGLHEFLVLNTCNRIELLAVASGREDVADVLRRILGFDHLRADDYYLKRGFEAFEHVAVTCAGLLSQTPGENHIVAQVKEALELAVTRGWASGMVQEWVAAGLHVSKDIRQVTGPMLKNYEIEDLCLQYLAAECPGLAARRTLVLGAGLVGEGLVRRLLAHDPASVCTWCYHVNRPAVPPEWQGRVTLCTLNDLRHALADVELVLCATASSGHVLHQGHAPFFDQEKDIRIVDLAMPRNVAPELNGLMPNLSVVDLDDLKHWFRREAVDMARVFEGSTRVAQEHRELYDRIIRSLQGGHADQ
jgi:precorrin-2 dehydrogenase/sirohydrochlorin ferrochelatase